MVRERSLQVLYFVLYGCHNDIGALLALVMVLSRGNCAENDQKLPEQQHGCRGCEKLTSQSSILFALSHASLQSKQMGFGGGRSPTNNNQVIRILNGLCVMCVLLWKDTAAPEPHSLLTDRCGHFSSPVTHTVLQERERTDYNRAWLPQTAKALRPSPVWNTPS